MKILLLKEKKEPDKYFDLLSDIGEVEYIPVLSISFVNQDQLENRIQGKLFTSIIFTSGNAVKAVERIMKSGIIDHSTLKAMKCYVVGKATEKLAKDLGFECFGSNAGNADDLASLIIEDFRTDGGSPRYLFPCGQMKRETLPNKMLAAGCDLACITTYHTSEESLLFEKITTFANKNTQSEIIAAFFSPSGVTFTLPKLLSIYGNELKGLHCAAIGKSTAEELHKNGVKPCCIAQRPSPESLATAIQFFLSNQYSSRQDDT